MQVKYWDYLMPLIIFPVKALRSIYNRLSDSLTPQKMGGLKKLRATIRLQKALLHAMKKKVM